MKSCEKDKNRGGKETEKEISKLFVPIPDWEEKSKPGIFPAKQKHDVLGSRRVMAWSPQAAMALPNGVMEHWGAAGSVHPMGRSVETAPPCPISTDVSDPSLLKWVVVAPS